MVEARATRALCLGSPVSVVVGRREFTVSKLLQGRLTHG